MTLHKTKSLYQQYVTSERMSFEVKKLDYSINSKTKIKNKNSELLSHHQVEQPLELQLPTYSWDVF